MNRKINLLESGFLVFLPVIADFFLGKKSDFLYFILLLFWFLSGRYYKIDGKVFVAEGVVILFLSSYFMIFNNTLAEKAGCLAFLLFFTGILLEWLEMKKTNDL